MKFERVDENTIKCYLTLEELAEYDLDYTDFLSRSEKAQHLMQHIIEQAREAVDYHPPKLAFEMQIMMVPEQGMVLTFSEKEPIDLSDTSKVESFLNKLKDVAQKLTDYRDGKIEDLPFMGGMQGASKNQPAASGAGQKPQGVAGMQNMPGALSGEVNASGTIKDPQDENLYEAVFNFDRLPVLMEYVACLPANLRVTSSLYKMDDCYYLYMTKGGASYDRFSRACVQALNFAGLYRAGKGCDEILQEHGECLIAEKAIKKLRG